MMQKVLSRMVAGSHAFHARQRFLPMKCGPPAQQGKRKTAYQPGVRKGPVVYAVPPEAASRKTAMTKLSPAIYANSRTRAS